MKQWILILYFTVISAIVIFGTLYGIQQTITNRKYVLKVDEKVKHNEELIEQLRKEVNTIEKKGD